MAESHELKKTVTLLSTVKLALIKIKFTILHIKVLSDIIILAGIHLLETINLILQFLIYCISYECYFKMVAKFDHLVLGSFELLVFKLLNFYELQNQSSV